MKVSIITIAYNSAETIKDTIVSVLSQDYAQIEYVIIDGGSSDGTLDIIKAFDKDIDVLVSEPDKGIYDAMNKGVSRCTGDVVGILNSDDYYAHAQVISHVAACFNDTQADGIYADLQYVDREDPNKIIRHWHSGPYTPGMFLKGWMPPHPTFYVKRSLYKKYGAFDTRLRSSADYELMLRFIHKHGIKLAYLNEVITKMRVGGQSNVSLKNRLRANKEDRLAWEYNGLRPGIFTLIRKPLSKLTQYIKK